LLSLLLGSNIDIIIITLIMIIIIIIIDKDIIITLIVLINDYDLYRHYPSAALFKSRKGKY